ncbi:hypothetical protein WR25_22562 [Diploscapter pachys]|uniref:Uncharacterized protein n=1 Tax=Diploscapter pachys TaxID=2018661 RepID=A0A2A2JXV8_9BILA|nr:hypothetical protein WR25_22562 [Diploscapter pachys]
MIRVMETAIVDFYSATGINDTSGNVAQHISDTMEHYYGGLWTVSLFDTAYTFAYTAQKKSPAFAVFDVNENGISIAKDGY